MNVSFLISADGQTDGYYSCVECYRQKGGDTVRLVGRVLWILPTASVHATSPHYRVLFKHVCEPGWMSWEIWWQALTSIIRAGCNTGRSHGHLKILFFFWFRSWCDLRAAAVPRTGRQSYGAGSSSRLWNKAHSPKHSPISCLTPSRPPIPAHTELNRKQK